MGAQAVRLSNVDINNALENKDFEVLFQPIFDLGNGALARMETFVRWLHPSLGVLPPGAFISFFESQGRMGELTRYILGAALERYGEWRGPYAPGFSINLSLADLADDAFATHLATLLKTHDFPAELITLECPMPAVDADLEGMMGRIAQLRETGVRLAIEVRGRADEFLRTVDPFPFDEIKTGGSSILRFARTVRGPGLSAISDLLDIAKKANAVTTAVGVEDQASLSALRGLGFTAAQGTHLAKVGGLNEFRPSHVNHVRSLLDLPALNGDELAALFRTTAPVPGGAEIAPPEQSTLIEEVAVEVVEPEPVVTGTRSAELAAEKPASDEDKEALLARARKKAKAIALAKRARARDARKAAAIKRAKAKVALTGQQPDDAALDQDSTGAPHRLQNRIEQEFSDAQHNAPAASLAPAAASSSAMASSGSTETEALNIQMQVGAAGVQFRPGVCARSQLNNYAGEKFDRPPHQQATAPRNENTADPAVPDIAFADDNEADAPADNGAEISAAPDTADIAHTIDHPDETASTAADSTEPQSARRRGRKNVLTRKYKIVPTHFWPKPWKRAWRQRLAAQEQSSAQA